MSDVINIQPTKPISSSSDQDQVTQVTEKAPAVQESQIDQLKSQMDGINDCINGSDQKGIISLKDQIKDAQNSATKTSIESFGVFFALLAFITFAFQIFIKIDNLNQALVAIFVLAGILGYFVVLILSYTRNFYSKNEWFETFLIISPLFFIVIAIVIGGLGIGKDNKINAPVECNLTNINDNDCIVKKIVIDKMVEDRTNQKIQELEKTSVPSQTPTKQ